jgi:hypothetical protein
LRRCTNCGEEKDESAFYTRKDGSPVTKCKACHMACCKEARQRNRLRYWAIASISGHRKLGHLIQITTDELQELASHATNCPMCGVEFDWGPKTKSGARPNSPSVDRVGNEKVLDAHNIQIICRKCNYTKSDRSMAEFVDYCKRIVERFGAGC